MAKPARIAKANSASLGSLIGSFVFLGAALCLMGLLFKLIHQLLPLLQVVVPMLLIWWFWQRYRRVQNRQQKHLYAAFYRLLQEHQGRITLLDFAMTAAIPAIAARPYLDSRAREFAARFEVTEQGDVMYVFSSLQFSRLQPPVDMPTALADNTSSPALPPSLTQAELAKRLGVAAKTISRKKHSPLLSDWTQARDPDGVGWAYAAHTQRFLPLSAAQAEKAL